MLPTIIFHILLRNKICLVSDEHLCLLPYCIGHDGDFFPTVFGVQFEKHWLKAHFYHNLFFFLWDRWISILRHLSFRLFTHLNFRKHFMFALCKGRQLKAQMVTSSQLESLTSKKRSVTAMPPVNHVLRKRESVPHSPLGLFLLVNSAAATKLLFIHEWCTGNTRWDDLGLPRRISMAISSPLPLFMPLCACACDDWSARSRIGLMRITAARGGSKNMTKIPTGLPCWGSLTAREHFCSRRTSCLVTFSWRFQLQSLPLKTAAVNSVQSQPLGSIFLAVP